MVRGIGIGNLSLLHIDFDDGKASDQPGIDAIDTDVSNGLILRRRLTIQCRDIDDVSLGIYEVDVGILIDGNQALGLLAPADMGDMGIVQAVGTVIGRDTLIIEVILIKSVGGQYEEIIVSCMDILYLMIGELMFPSADLRPYRAK